MTSSIIGARAPDEGTGTKPRRKLTEEEAQVLSDKTLESLAEKGWCVWRCNKVLQGDTIVLVDEQLEKEGLAKGMPRGYPVYTLAELASLVDAGDSTIRLAHEAKKAAGAEIVGRR